MYPAVTQFETRQEQVERELQLDREREARIEGRELVCVWACGFKVCLWANA